MLSFQILDQLIYTLSKTNHFYFTNSIQNLNQRLNISTLTKITLLKSNFSGLTYVTLPLLSLKNEITLLVIKVECISSNILNGLLLFDKKIF